MRNRFLIIMFCICCSAARAEKQVFIPTEFSTDPVLKTWSWSKSYQSVNFVVFWGNVVGTNPAAYPNPDLRFDPKSICDTLETIYKKYITEIKFCRDDSSTNLGKYKLIIVMNDTWGAGGPSGWAFGGAYDDVIGAMWVHPNATRDGGVTSHELTHSLQGMNMIQENKVGGGFNNDIGGFFWETHANFMRTQMYPKFAPTDMPRWLATGMYHWSSTRHHYDAYDLLFTIQQKDSIQMINRLWHESLPNEHPLITYSRLKGWNQNQLNDFIYEYAKREVTADYTVNGAGALIRQERKRLKTEEPHYLWRQYTMLKQINAASGRYAVPDIAAPQDYGFNIIPLHTTCTGKNVHVKFKGHAEVNATAGWRYGFVAVKADDSTVRYSPLYSANESEISFQVNTDETQLYLVVIGAPTTHTSYVWEPGFPKIKKYPYELTIENALPEGYQQGYRSAYKVNGHAHSNGGGWVSNTTTVASTVYIGPNALVLGNSSITGHVKIDGNARVEDAVMKDNVTVSGNANVWNGTYSNNVQIGDNAVVNFCNVSGNVIIKGNAMEWGPTFSGTVNIGGDAEIGDCSTAGLYLQTPHPNNGRTDCDGKNSEDISNIDVNKTYVPFTDAQMAFSSIIGCSTLPLKLLSFTGNHKSGVNYLQWLTANEINNNYFEVQYSFNAIDFIKAGTVKAMYNGSSGNTYTFNHSTNSKLVYYRLKQVDDDGAFTYSPIIKISNDGALNQNIKLRTNPVNDHIILDANFNTVFNGTATIFDMRGKIFYCSSISFLQGVSMQNINVSRLAAGNYILKISATDNKQKPFVIQFVKE